MTTYKTIEGNTATTEIEVGNKVYVDVVDAGSKSLFTYKKVIATVNNIYQNGFAELTHENGTIDTMHVNHLIIA